VLRLRIEHIPPGELVDGIELDGFVAGHEYLFGNSLGALLLAEGWAEPVPLDAPATAVPFTDAGYC
jgi:hypothetical protein